MANCKYCGTAINWLQNNGKYTPLHLDGSLHLCKNKPQQQGGAQQQQQQFQTRQTQAPQQQQYQQPQAPPFDMGEINRKLEALMLKLVQIETMVKLCMPYTPLDEPQPAQMPQQQEQQPGQ
jgi:hypothetical protein